MSNATPPPSSPIPAWIHDAIEQSAISRGALFVSDLHLGIETGTPDRESHFLRLLADLDERIEDLVLGGDTFEFWMEWCHVAPKGHAKILHALRQLHQRGTRLHFIRGNHDFALGSHLAAMTGAVLYDNGLCLEIGGRKFLFLHGDGMCPSDRADRLVRHVLRHPLANFLYRLLHPDLGMWIAHRVGGTTRNANPGPAPNMDEYQETACTWMQQTKLSGIVHGHTHRPLRVESEAGVYLNNGDWTNRRSCVLICDHQALLLDAAQGILPWPLNI